MEDLLDKLTRTMDELRDEIVARVTAERKLSTLEEQFSNLEKTATELRHLRQDEEEIRNSLLTIIAEDIVSYDLEMMGPISEQIENQKKIHAIKHLRLQLIEKTGVKDGVLKVCKKAIEKYL